MLVYRLARPLLFRLDAERAHGVGKTLLRTVAATPRLRRHWERRHRVADPRLERSLLGRRFANPVGLAAGFDKDGEVIAALPALGFGFAEIGTVTPLPQPGNPKPRLFRYPRERSLQNRLGFNNRGADALARRLDALPAQLRARLPLGVNLGKNKATPAARAMDDYRSLLATFAPRADYLVINVSSPNTPGLRDLQSEAFLRPLLAEAGELSACPVLVKIAPDLEEQQAVDLCAMAVEAGADGVIATNTTVDHALLPGCEAAGGLSGAVLKEKARNLFAAVARELYGRCVLVSVGGIDGADEAYRRIRAGADLVQLYTALVFAGPDLVAEINRGLLARLERDGLRSLDEAVGADLRAGASASAEASTDASRVK
jgi:dihydroorotate dehydrogenase